MKEKFLGTILGCAVGDALGAPFEGLRGSVIRTEENLVKGYKKIPNYPLGQYTDDTQLTLALAETYIANRCFKGTDFARRLAELWAKGEIIGAGRSCTDAVRNIQRGKRWQEAGTEEGRTGNGTAMRASPVGLWNYDTPDQLKKDAIFQSQVTHRDSRAKAGACAVAWAVAYNLTHERMDAEEFISGVAEFVKDVNEEFSRHLARLSKWLEKDEHIAILEISCAGWIDPPRWIDMVTPFVIPTVLIALYNFLRSPKDFSLTLERTLRVGGDTDTTCAIAGAISGSFNGVSAIPEQLLLDLYQRDLIENTALRLWQAKQS